MLTISSRLLVSKLTWWGILSSLILVLVWIMSLQNCCGSQQIKESVVLSAINSIVKDAQKIAKVELLLDKQEYFLGENILLHYGVINQGKKSFSINTGHDYRGSPRHLRFKVSAFDANDKQVKDPYPTSMNMGGLGGGSTLEPGRSWWISLPLMRYCYFENPGVYKIKVYHDLGWDGDYHDNLYENALPKGEHNSPVVETSIRLVMPDIKQAQQVIDHILKLPSDPMAMDKQKVREYRDFSVLRYPVYLPIVFDLVGKGDERGLEAIGSIETPQATQTLIDLLDNTNKNISSNALTLLLQRLPIPQTKKNMLWNQSVRNRMVEKSWLTNMKDEVMSHGWKLLAENNRQSLINGSNIIMSLGSREDLPKFERFLNQGLIAMKNDPIEQGSFPRPLTASDSLTEAGWELIERGAAVPTDTRTPGGAVLYMLELGKQDDFRPADWQKTALESLGHPIPFVRAKALENLPKEFPPSQFHIIADLIEDKYIYVQVNACQFATKTSSSQFQTPLLNVVRTTRDEWLLREAFDTALSCGVNRDSLMEICAERLSNDNLAVTILDLLNEIVDRIGGWGYSQVDWSNVNEIKAEWKKFIESNRERIRSGPKFQVAKPPLTKNLYPRGFSFYPPNKPQWPQW